jgi:hypothetical protein
MEKINVSPIEIRDYAISQNWTIVQAALNDGLYVLNSPYNDYMQLIFPKDELDSYFQEMAWNVLGKLSKINNFTLTKMIEEIREVNDDVICLRYYSENKNVNSISFEGAFDAIDATRKMLLSAASSVVSPALFYPVLNRTEAQEFIKKARFRHTEEGSFILKISHPCEIISNYDLFGEHYEKPFSRSAFEIINISAIKISNAIEADAISKLFDEERCSSAPIISYNFCENLSKLFDDEREIPFQLIFNWSKSSLQKISLPASLNRISFPYSVKSKIEEVKSHFEPPKRDFLQKETFFGTVDTLDGDVGLDGKRSGSVTITILYNNDTFKSRINLTPDKYQIAVNAHQKGNVLVKIVGDLQRERSKRIQSIENVQSFNLVE